MVENHRWIASHIPHSPVTYLVCQLLELAFFILRDFLRLCCFIRIPAQRAHKSANTLKSADTVHTQPAIPMNSESPALQSSMTPGKPQVRIMWNAQYVRPMPILQPSEAHGKSCVRIMWNTHYVWPTPVLQASMACGKSHVRNMSNAHYIRLMPVFLSSMARGKSHVRTMWNTLYGQPMPVLQSMAYLVSLASK